VSAETKAALDDAIRAHVADEGDGELRLMTDYYLVTAAISEDTSVTNYLHVSSDSGTHVLIGLVHIGARRLNAHFDDD
jgi:hypothetical protein